MEDTPVRENQLDSGFEEYVTENKTIDRSIYSNKTSSISPDDLKNIIEKVENDNGKFVKDNKGRYLIVYSDDSVLLSNYHLSIPHEEISDDSRNSEFRSRVDLCMQGIEDQRVKKYPFTVIKNPKNKKLLQPSRTGEYRQHKEYSTVEVLYKHPSEFTIVEVVKDVMTGFKHICKTIIISKFRPEELNSMAVMQNIAPELFGICRDGENVRLHMEYIQGVRLDFFSKMLLDQNAWPVCLHLFGELAKAINKLGVKHLSHGDIHVKNVILEVDSDNSLRIRLLDYGDASNYSLSGLMNDMKSLVACIITVFTENEFDSYEEDPVHWISTCKALYPTLCAMLQGALMVKDTGHLTKLIEDIDHIIKDQIDYKRNLKEAASTIQETTKPKHITLEEDLRNLDISSDKRFATNQRSTNAFDTTELLTFQEYEILHDLEVETDVDSGQSNTETLPL